MAGSNSQLTIGVLAFQGDVREHLLVLESLGASTRKVRRPEELEGLHGLIIPGGESSVMDKLTRHFGMQKPLQQAIINGLPAFGTCAGLIMLSNNIIDAIDEQESLGVLDVSVRRNAFGAQVDSFETLLDVPLISERPIAATFIRAPIVEKHSDDVLVLATLDNGNIVAVKQDNILAISFHPEVNGDKEFHEYFLTMARDYAKQTKATI